MCVVGVQVGEQHDVRMGGVPGWNLATDSTEMAHPSGQNWVEQKGCAAVLPGDGAVAPPGHRAGHGVPVPRGPRIAAPGWIPAVMAVRNAGGAYLGLEGGGGETSTSVLAKRAATQHTSGSSFSAPSQFHIRSRSTRRALRRCTLLPERGLFDAPISSTTPSMDHDPPGTTSRVTDGQPLPTQLLTPIQADGVTTRVADESIW